MNMPNHNEHFIWGAVAGAGYCLSSSLIRGREISIAELLGGALSGAVASKLPDSLEPAIHPNHRSTFHSLCFLAGAGVVVLPWMEEKRQRQYQLADYARSQANASVNESDRRYWQQKTLWHEFVAGLFAGLVVGYISHLVADSFTPKGLPIL
jgi:inner membrane protein